MREQEFIAYLDGHSGEFDYQHGDYQGDYGVYIKNKRFETETHISYMTIERQDLDTLVKATHAGRNVDQITRVTGFFSKVSAWNKGKRGELTERHRSDI